MFPIITTTIGAVCIGFGTGSVWVGVGVWVIILGVLFHINQGLTTVYTALRDHIARG